MYISPRTFGRVFLVRNARAQLAEVVEEGVVLSP